MTGSGLCLSGNNLFAYSRDDMHFSEELMRTAMKKKHLQPLTLAALYARVSSDRQDVDLSVSAH